MRKIITSLCFLILSPPAFAHGGHLGELAGHAHWIGLGAIVVAGTIAAVLGATSSDDEAQEELEETETASEAA